MGSMRLSPPPHVFLAVASREFGYRTFLSVSCRALP
jgi:hypothetical protein